MPLSRAVRAAVLAAAVAGCATVVPRAVCGRDAGAFFAGDRDAEDALARTVIVDVAAGVGPGRFHTGSARFDGEWAVATYQMAMLGLGQIILEHPEQRSAYLPAMEVFAERLLAPEATAFGTEAWGARGLDDEDVAHGHAYLGYVDLALSMLRAIDGKTRFAAAHDRLTAALVRRLEAAPYGLVETYPGEAYPVDVSASVGAIGLYDATTGADHRALLRRWGETFRARWVDAPSGMAFQSGEAATGKPTSAPRASGTALAAYFLSFADRELAGDLTGALRRGQRGGFLGFGAMREYPPGWEGRGDVDSGPVLFGVSVSGTGFALGGALVAHDQETFTALYRTAELFGVLVRHGEGRRFLSGGPLGNAILLAMLTAQEGCP